jgi:hypothetical protein
MVLMRAIDEGRRSNIPDAQRAACDDCNSAIEVLGMNLFGSNDLVQY